MANKNQFKIYLDEDSVEFGKHLKDEHNLNVIIPDNFGKSIPDEFQLRLAISKKAFILTKNKNDFMNKIPNIFNKIKNAGIIIWNTNNFLDICYDVRYLCTKRNLNLKGKIYILNNEGIRVISREGESKLELHMPCEICKEKCSNRKGKFLS